MLRRRVPLRARREYVPPRPSDPISKAVRAYVYARDMGCVVAKLDAEHRCWGFIEIDHVRASGGMGLKSASDASNLVSLCSLAHQTKTNNGREWRPRLLDYLATVEAA